MDKLQKYIQEQLDTYDLSEQNYKRLKEIADNYCSMSNLQIGYKTAILEQLNDDMQDDDESPLLALLEELKNTNN
jgi:hypothetical protein